MMSRKMSLLLGGVLLLAGASGCSDQIEPGDYVVYRIASAQQEFSSSCNLTANEISDSSTVHVSGTVILFAGQEGEFYLDTGEVTLPGEFTGESDAGMDYEFDGKTVDVEWSNPEGTGTKLVSTVKHEVDLTIDDELLSGETRIKYSYQCSGEGCANTLPKCTVTTEFVGTEVEDVDLEHNVN